MSYYCYFDSGQNDGHTGYFFLTKGNHVHILNLNTPPQHTHTQAHLFIASVNNVWSFVTTDDCGTVHHLWSVFRCSLHMWLLRQGVKNRHCPIIFSVMSCEWILIIQRVDVVITYFQNSYNQHTSIPLPKYLYLRMLKLGVLEIPRSNTLGRSLIHADHQVVLGCWNWQSVIERTCS